ncbi:MAG: hypothetical protein G01um101438_352 [Parcubacteria group bacterium Gr01-1014_38]|nr:MAG: hypothetical protein G01um101438_352 [Parcubacteria group bacterium Gr01-1014_38]
MRRDLRVWKWKQEYHAYDDGFSMMSGAYGSGMMFWGWVLYALVVVALVLGIAALWKYVTKK